MVKKLRLVSNKLSSNSLKEIAKGLSNALSYKVWRSRFPKLKRTNLLYGDCKGKIEQYKFFKENSIEALEYTTSHKEACEWVANGHTVVARTLTRASEGKGIIITEPEGQVAVAPVYTIYRKKKKEFRVHIFKDNVVQVLEKRRKIGVYNGESKIRNTANGYCFCSGNVVEPDGIRALALAASKVTNSDFKGVDIGYNEKLNELFVIEVNSAPGIMGSNVQRYIEAIVKNA